MVVDLRVEDGEVVVTTEDGSVRAAHAVVAADAWTNRVLAPLGRQLPLTVLKEQVTWFEVDDPDRFTAERLPGVDLDGRPRLVRLPGDGRGHQGGRGLRGHARRPRHPHVRPRPGQRGPADRLPPRQRRWRGGRAQLEDLPLHAHPGPGLRARPGPRGARGAGRPGRGAQLQVRGLVRPDPGRARPRRPDDGRHRTLPRSTVRPSPTPTPRPAGSSEPSQTGRSATPGRG